MVITATIQTPRIRVNVLRNPCYPVHRIADQLLPYLDVLVEKFEPEQVILFGVWRQLNLGADDN